MTRISIAALILAAATAAPLSPQCIGGTQPCHVIPIGNVFDGAGGPFLSGNTYVIAGPVTVPSGQTLTVQPGAVVKFAPDFTLPRSILVMGTLNAQGTPGSPITFTSYFDDSVGGDTNGDGSATTPASNDWKGIFFAGSSGGVNGNQMTFCDVLWGGRSSVLETDTSAVTLQGCTIAHGTDVGFKSRNSTQPTVTGCAFDDLDQALTRLNIESVASFVGNVATNMQNGNDYLPLSQNGSSTLLQTSATWSPANTLNASGVLALPLPLGVGQNTTLTLDPGMVFKATQTGAAFLVSGTLTAIGTPAAPIVFTSIEDDQFGGDTTANGAGTPAPGDWNYIGFGFQAGASQMQECVIRYAGGTLNTSAIQTGSANVTLDSVAVEFCGGPGLLVGLGQPTITGCAFDDNLRAVAQLPISAAAGFTGNTASGNLESDALTLGGGILQTPLTLGPQNYLGGGAIQIASTFEVNLNGSLLLSPGTVLKLASGAEVRVNGTLDGLGTAAQPVVLTAYADDQYGGDTNKDGSATTPSPGDWKGLRWANATAPCILQNAIVRYAGGGAPAAIDVTSSDVTFTDCMVQHSATKGLDVSQGSTTTVTGCAFDDGAALPVAIPLSNLPTFTGNSASGNASGDELHLGGTTIISPVAFDSANTLNQSGVIVIDGTLTIATAGGLTLGSGLILKLSGAYAINCQGLFDCTAGPVWITSLADDSIGGDSGGDGPTTGSPGDWNKLSISGAGSTCSQLTARFGGSASPAVQLLATGITLDQCTVENSADDALFVALNSQPTVTNCAFDNNDRAMAPMTMTDLDGFANNTASGNAQGNNVEISDFGGVTATVRPQAAFNQTGAFVVTQSLSGSSGLNVTIESGVTLKFEPNLFLSTQTNLTCNGTANDPVVFTSIRDDQYGGDTNGDGNATLPAPGDWQGLDFGAGAGGSVLEHTIVRYAGAGGTAAISTFANITLIDVTVEQSAGPGLDVNGIAAPTISGGSIQDNNGVAIAGVTWALLGNISGVSVSGNSGGNATVISAAGVVGDVVVYPHSYFGESIVVTVAPTFGTGASLTFMPGVILKFPPGIGMDIRGGGVKGTALEPVVFTSLADDDWGGDTNGDGNASQPQPGDWVGLISGSADHALVRYADQIGLEGAALQGCRAEHIAGTGIELQRTVGLSSFANGCVAWDCGGAGIYSNGGRLLWCTTSGNQGRGIDGTLAWSSAAIACNSWDNGGSGNDNYPVTLSAWGSVNGSGWSIYYSNGTNIGQCTGTQPQFGTCNTWGHDNLNVDPLFVDAANGDLRLQGSSPLIDHVPNSEFFPTSVASNVQWNGINVAEGVGAQDALDSPRMLDSDLGGPAPLFADVGAYEYRRFVLSKTGQPQQGNAVQIQVTGPAGLTFLYAGLDPDGAPPLFVPGPGWYLGGDPSLIVDLGTILTGQTYTLQIPTGANFLGQVFQIQGLAFTGGAPYFTGFYRSEIY